jgi:uncharacterized membrane protein YesL
VSRECRLVAAAHILYVIAMLYRFSILVSFGLVTKNRNLEQVALVFLLDTRWPKVTIVLTYRGRNDNNKNF